MRFPRVGPVGRERPAAPHTGGVAHDPTRTGRLGRRRHVVGPA